MQKTVKRLGALSIVLVAGLCLGRITSGGAESKDDARVEKYIQNLRAGIYADADLCNSLQSSANSNDPCADERAVEQLAETAFLVAEATWESASLALEECEMCGTP